MAKKNIFNNQTKDCESNQPVTDERPYDRISEGKPVRRAFNGLLNTPTPEERITYNASTGEKVIANGNSYITFGQDKPESQAGPGMGAIGARSETIDLVVGRVASANGGDGPCDGMFVGNSFGSDAARIYISRLTKIDKNFGIDRHPLEESPEQARSAVGVKADQVRIVGRQNVKIITGGARGVKFGGPFRRGEPNSLGGQIPYAGKIDLIAGNVTGQPPKWFPGSRLANLYTQAYLQPLVKGDNMVACMEDILDMLDDIQDAINKISTTGISAFGAIAMNTKDIGMQASMGAAQTSLGIFATGPIWRSRIRTMGMRVHYLMPRSPRRITSRNVSTT